MDDANFVGCRESATCAETSSTSPSFSDQRASFAQRLAIDKLGGDEIHRVALVDLVNRDDVWMVQRGSSPG
jgi:hypothetical protein